MCTRALQRQLQPAFAAARLGVGAPGLKAVPQARKAIEALGVIDELGLQQDEQYELCPWPGAVQRSAGDRLCALQRKAASTVYS